eukprot:732878_1
MSSLFSCCISSRRKQISGTNTVPVNHTSFLGDTTPTGVDQKGRHCSLATAQTDAVEVHQTVDNILENQRLASKEKVRLRSTLDELDEYKNIAEVQTQILGDLREIAGVQEDNTIKHAIEHLTKDKKSIKEELDISQMKLEKISFKFDEQHRHYQELKMDHNRLTLANEDLTSQNDILSDQVKVADRAMEHLEHTNSELLASRQNLRKSISYLESSSGTSIITSPFQYSVTPKSLWTDVMMSDVLEEQKEEYERELRSKSKIISDFEKRCQELQNEIRRGDESMWEREQQMKFTKIDIMHLKKAREDDIQIITRLRSEKLQLEKLLEISTAENPRLSSEISGFPDSDEENLSDVEI